MSNKLIGRDPNQVPSNADLGSAAFQEQETFLKAKGATMSAIRGIIHTGTLKVKIYDTTQDSDGGAWRHTAKNNSWYNEELNTSTRGSRREFPSIAILCVETHRLVIYDGDDPDLPMWMIWRNDRSPITAIAWYTSGSGYVKDAKGINGEIIIALGGGALFANFIKDDIRVGYNSTDNYQLIERSIEKRNNCGGGTTIAGGDKIPMAHYNSTSVDAMVLPDDTIDHATGLPSPSIVFGSADNITVIRGTDGGKRENVSFITGTSQGESSDYVAFTGAGKILYSHGYAVVLADVPGSNDSAAYFNQTSTFISRISNQTTHQDSNTPSVPGSIVSYPTRVSNSTNKFAVSGNDADGGFSYVDDLRFFNTPYGFRTANIAPKYNTGWQVGNTLFSGLSTVDAHPISGGEKVPNGNFTNNLSGWTAVGSGNSISHHNSNSLSVSRGGSSQAAVAYCNVGLSKGKKYVLRANILQDGGSNNDIFRLGINTTAYVEDIDDTNGVTGNISVTFTPTADRTTLWIYAYPNQTTIVDSVSITEADENRAGQKNSNNQDARRRTGDAQTYAYSNEAVTHNAYIYRSPVASGADLCGYHFNNADRNFMAALISDNIGTGDLHLRFWIKPLTASQSGYFHMVSLAPSPYGSGQQSGQGFTFKAATGASNGWAPYLYTGAGGGDNATYQPSSCVMKVGEWQQMVLQRRGGVWQIYINGRLITTGSTNAFSITDRYIQIHNGHGSEFADDAEMALVRLSMGSTTEQRIYQMYQDELPMFQENAKSTIYGNTGQVSALAWDPVEDSLYVGNASGRNKFNGLVRTDHKLDAVSYSLGASNGLVAEE